MYFLLKKIIQENVRIYFKIHKIWEPFLSQTIPNNIRMILLYFIEMWNPVITCNVCMCRWLLRREQKWQVSEKTGHHGNLLSKLLFVCTNITNNDKELLYLMDHMTCCSLYYHSKYLMIKYLPAYRVFLNTWNVGLSVTRISVHTVQ